MSQAQNSSGSRPLEPNPQSQTIPPTAETENPASSSATSSEPQPPATSASSSTAAGADSVPPESQDLRSHYDELRRLIPSLASELSHLRTALREHNVWLQRYGQPSLPGSGSSGPAAPPPSLAHPRTVAPPPPSPAPASASSISAPAEHASSLATNTGSDPELPAYSASDLPPYTHSSARSSDWEEVHARRDQLTEWLSEGEDVLREYSARFAQLAEQLSLTPEDVLGTWNGADPDNALPDYRVVEDREDRMVGGVGEVPPPYLGGGITRGRAGG